jgi:hypothetical protein
MGILFAIVVFLPAFSLAMHLSRHRALGQLRGSALNPLLLVAMFVVLAAGDFANVAAFGYGELGGHLVRPVGLTSLTAKFAVLLTAFVGGIALVFYLPSLWAARPVRPTRPRDLRFLLLVVYIVLLTAWLYTVVAYSPQFFSLEGSVETKRATRGDTVVYLTSLLLLPALCYGLARQPIRIALPLVAVTVAILFFSGSRTRLLYALVPFLFYLVMVRGIRLPRSWFLIGVVVLGFLSIAALNVRLLISYGEAASAERVFAITNPFNLNDLSTAEANIALSNMGRSRVNNYPGENMISFFAAPLPRSVAPFKPLSGSVQFTQAFDPERWRISGSGLVIGAPNEISGDYPYPVALIVVWLFGMVWALALLRALRSPSIHGFAWTIALYLFIYNFFRNDLFIAGGALWVFVFYWLAVEVGSRWLPTARAGFHRQGRSFPSTAAELADARSAPGR